MIRPRKVTILSRDAAFRGTVVSFSANRTALWTVTTFFGGDSVPVDDDVAGEVRDGDDAVSGAHSVQFDGVNLGVYVSPLRVILRSVHVYDEGFSGDPFCGDSGVVRKPVVSVDDVELSFEVACHLSGDDGIAGDLFHEVGAVFFPRRCSVVSRHRSWTRRVGPI